MRIEIRKSFWGVVAMSTLMLIQAPLQGYEILGVGTESLVGGDLTDPENDGLPEEDTGYNALFDSNDEPGFGGGEFAFNVFDNVLGGGNDKWCCGKTGGISDNEPSWVQAKLSEPFYLTSFTLSSANDVPERDPSSWALQGSNNGVDFTDIYVYDDAAGPWTERLQVIKFNGGDDFPTQTESYDYFRLAVFNTPNNPNGAYLQLSEIELFGAAVPEPSSLVLMLLGVTGAGLHRRRR